MKRLPTGLAGLALAWHETSGGCDPALIRFRRSGVVTSAAEPTQFGSTATGLPAMTAIAPWICGEEAMSAPEDIRGMLDASGTPISTPLIPGMLSWSCLIIAS